MRLSNFRIPAAIIGFVLIAKPALAADAMVLFKNVPGDPNPINGNQEQLAAFNKGGSAKMGDRTTNQASFVIITSGLWQFCDRNNFKDCIELGRGRHDLRNYNFNDKISSFRRLR